MNRDPIVQTERVRIQRLGEKDLPWLYELHENASVNRFRQPATVHLDHQAVRKKLQMNLRNEARLGFGMWKMVLHSGEAIGCAGFSLCEETSEVELEFYLAEPYWGQKYASEVTEALVNWFFENTYFTHLIAKVHPDNIGARVILNRLDFYFRENLLQQEQRCDVMQLLSPVFQKMTARA
ncbi:GNAT family N-acetyltransferase [Polycladidibacter stylochi]|uniref:GNAT family N-acetyltransferase n=1 Tax=Polycladidibacter stylochi TaxID=1807766 RepID=UPI0008326C1A|nr:GNAT family N-acetyltransferase [Pseudovibrio stylochi]